MSPLGGDIRLKNRQQNPFVNRDFAYIVCNLVADAERETP
jgi:hypothetical protein